MPSRLMRRQTERMYFILERLFVIGALLNFAGAILPLLKNPGDSTLDMQASDPSATLLQLLIYAGAMIYMFPNRARLLKTLAANPVLCGFLLLILISCTWSSLPFFSLRRAIWFVLTTAFGLDFGPRFEPKEQMRLIAYALGLCVDPQCCFRPCLTALRNRPRYI